MPDWLGLAGQRAIVAGGAGTIGAAVTLGLLDAGASVAAVDRDPERLAALRDASGGRLAGAVVADLGDAGACRTAIGDALSAGETNYPPSNGIPELRKSVTRFYAHGLGLEYPVDSVLIAGGARPIIYAIYRALCDPGDRVLVPRPSYPLFDFLAALESVHLHPYRLGFDGRFVELLFEGCTQPLHACDFGIQLLARGVDGVAMGEVCADERRGALSAIERRGHLFELVRIAGREEDLVPAVGEGLRDGDT